MHHLKVTMPGHNMLQGKDQSTFPLEKLQDSQCLNYHGIHEPPHFAMLAHLTAMGGRQEQSCISHDNHLILTGTTALPLDTLLCLISFCGLIPWNYG